MNTIDLINKQIEFLEKCRDELSCDEQKFPAYRLSPDGDFIVRIDNENKCEAVASSDPIMQVGPRVTPSASKGGIQHLLDEGKPIPYDKDRGLFHGQLVWAWSNCDTHERTILFYNAKVNLAFGYDGSLSERSKYDNYAPYEGEWPEWAYKAFSTLKLEV